MEISEINRKTPVFTTSFVTSDNAEIVFVSVDEEMNIQMFSEEGASVENNH